jgi:hypothetical protein
VLWIELLWLDNTNHEAYLRLHGTDSGKNYQLLLTNHLSNQYTEWTLGEIIQGASDTNQTDFSPTFAGTNDVMYFRAHQAEHTISVYTQSPIAYEPNLGICSTGLYGSFVIASAGATNSMTVRYRINGTATNGVDYATMSGSATITGNSSVELAIVPVGDVLLEGTETVNLEIIQTNNYLIEPFQAGAGVLIKDSSTTVSMGVVSPDEALEVNGPPGAPMRMVSFWLNRQDNGGCAPALAVRYAITGTASNGGDYPFLTGTITFAGNESNTNIDIVPVDDALIEGVETLTLTLLPATNYLIEPQFPSGTITISDSSTTVEVLPAPDSVDAIEPNPTSGTPAQTGYFTLHRFDHRSEYPALSISYALSGTAQNGNDYTNLTGAVTFPANSNYVRVYLQPKFDDAIENDETVMLSLLTSDSYLVSAVAPANLLTIFDNPSSNLFVRVANLTAPIGIDYHQPSNALLVSVNYVSPTSGGEPYNFARIYTNTVSSNLVTVITNWSGVHGVPDEIKVAIVNTAGAFTNAGGFTNGDMYFSSSSGIGWISADGTRSNLNWCILTNSVQTNALPLRGSLYVDRTGVFSNQLVAVTSPGGAASGNKGIWRVDAIGHPTHVTNINTLHLEGVITLTNDVPKWGPWAGKILTGDENAVDSNGFARPLTYTTSANGVTNSYALGIYPEDFDIIPPSQDLYACDYTGNAIVKLSRNYLTNHVGSLLITDAGESSFPGKLFIVSWDAATTNFNIISIPFKRPDGSYGVFEHVTFAPLIVPTLTQ